MKTHLDVFRNEKIDRVFFLTFYDSFFHFFKYSKIWFADFKRRSKKNKSKKKSSSNADVQKFDIINDEMNLSSTNKEKKTKRKHENEHEINDIKNM